MNEIISPGYILCHSKTDSSATQLPDRTEKCSGKGCFSKPTRRLRVNYIRKIGNFCQICSDDLISLGLAEDLGTENKSMEETME
jgi:hypothetical protein